MSVDYTFYTAEYHGFKIPELQFDYYAMLAADQLYCLTSGRVGPEFSTEAKKAICAIAEEYYRDEEDRVSSESVDGVSVSRRAAAARIDRRVRSIASRYLGSTGMLYRGV